MKKMRDFWGRVMLTMGEKQVGMGHSKVVTRRLVQRGSYAIFSENVKACSKVSKATEHCAQVTAGVRASQILVMTPLVPQAWRMSCTACPSWRMTRGSASIVT